jgi:hypothetical protein
MRPKTYTVSTAAVGQTPWHMCDYMANPFSVAFQVDIAGNTGTYTVEHGFCNMEKREAKISRSTTTATVTMLNHGLAVGDSVVVENGGAPFDGTYAVASVTDTSTFTYTVANSGAAAATDVRILSIRVMPHSSIAAQTTSKDGNYAFPVQFVRCRITVAGAGVYIFHVNQGRN